MGLGIEDVARPSLPGALGALALVLLLAIPVRAEDRVVLQLSGDHHFRFAGYYVARWLGYYAEKGLEVEIRPGLTQKGAPVSATREVSEGHAHFGVGGADILMANLEKTPLSVVASIFQKSAAAVLVHDGRGPEAPAMLTGKRVGRTDPRDPGWLEARVMMSLENIDVSKIAPVELEPARSDLIALFAKGDIHAIAGNSIELAWKAQQSGRKTSLLRPSAHGVDFYGDSIFTRTELAENEEDLVEAFVEASLRGWHWALEHPKETSNMMAKGLVRAGPVDDFSGLNAFAAAEVRRLALYPVVQFGHVNAERWRHMHRLLSLAEMDPPPLDLKRFVFDPVKLQISRQTTANWTMGGIILFTAVALVIGGVWGGMRQKIERRRIEDLRQSEERLRSVVENMPVLLTAVNHLGAFIVWNKECERVTGFTADEMIGDRRALEKIYPEPAYRKRVLSQWLNTGHEFRNWEWSLSAKDGTERTIEWSDISKEFPIPGWEGWGIGVDITGRRRAEEAADESEQRYRHFAESASDWFWEMGPDLRFSSVTDRFYEVADMTPDDVLGKSREEIAALSGEDLAIPYWQEHLDGLERHEAFRNFEYSVQDRNGRVRHIRISGRPLFDHDGNFMGYRGSGTDVTDRVESVRMIQDLAKFPEQNPGPVIRVDRDGRILYANAASKPVLAFWDCGVGDLVPDEDCRGRIVSALENGMGREEELDVGERTFLLALTPFPESGYVNIYGRDITERKHAEAALRESEERFRAIMEHAADAIMIHNLDGVIVDANQSACDLFGYDHEEILGLPVDEIDNDYNPATMRELWEWVLGAGPATVEAVARRRDGIEVPVEMRIGRLELANSDLLLVLARDITERKESEEALRHAKDAAESQNQAKSLFMASMGHELRAPLNAIIGFSDMLMSEMTREPVGPGCQEYAADINSAGAELLEIVNEMVDLSRLESEQLVLNEKVVDVEELVTACVRLLRENAGQRGVRMSQNTPDRMPPVRGDERRLRQILANLLSNAIDYNHDDGWVKLEAFVEKDGRLAFVISDGGPGMTADAVQAALSGGADDGAFVRRAKGGGLGIPLAKRLVEAHGGQLIIESKPREGTTARVLLPKERVGAK